VQHVLVCGCAGGAATHAVTEHEVSDRGAIGVLVAIGRHTNAITVAAVV